jgi:hypothetical protein
LQGSELNNVLQNVLEDYLESIGSGREREFDLPFMSLLAAMGFTDIHLTDGVAEFGKDFIAKRVEEGKPIQYSFQSKAGDINQPTWRNSIQGQMLESVLSPRTHPNFDLSLPHQTVLVLTGRLVGNAPLCVPDFNDTLARINKRPLEVWDRPKLIQLLTVHGLEGVHRATAAGFAHYGRFYSLYGKSIQGLLSEREIAAYSYYWVNEPHEMVQRMLVAAVEAESIARKCIENGLDYEAFTCYLGFLRALMHALYNAEDPENIGQLKQLHQRTLGTIRQLCAQLLTSFRRNWLQADRNFLSLVAGPIQIITYPVLCSRALEFTGLLYLLEGDAKRKKEIADFLEEFTSAEPGTSHPVSDRYAVSLIPSVLALCHAGRHQTAENILRSATVWLCDRYEKGAGLSSFESSVEDEVATLLGYPFEAVQVRQHPSSFLATLLCDLACFIGNPQLYEDVVNDVKAVEIVPQYWQPSDSLGQFSVEAEDVVQYPTAINHSDKYTPFVEMNFAEHIKSEPREFKIAGLTGSTSYMALCLLLRDRYFPSLWPLLVPCLKQIQ